jgi:hypothetical protein
MQEEYLGSWFWFLSKTLSIDRLSLGPPPYAAYTEAKFLFVIETKVVRVFLLAIFTVTCITGFETGFVM